MNAFYGDHYASVAETVFADSTASLLVDLRRVLADRPTDHPVLDFGCGYGRIATPLAEAGIYVVGVDRSPELIAMAQRRRARASRARFVVGDVKTAADIRASALLMIDSVLGDELQDEHEILRQLLPCLEPDSPVVLNSLNLHAVVRHLDADGTATFKLSVGEAEVTDAVTFDAATGTLTTTRIVQTVGKAEPDNTSSHRVSLRSPSGYVRLLQHCGLVVQGAFEEGGLRPLRLESSRVVVIARTPS